MLLPELLIRAKRYFPRLSIKYKDKNKAMRLLGKNFMEHDAISIGSSIYFPSHHFVKHHPTTSNAFFLYEITKMYDKNKFGSFLFYLSYFFPQNLSILFLFLFFILSCKLFLFLIPLALLPIPAYFRMLFEKRAYLTSLYCMNKMNKNLNLHIDIRMQKDFFIDLCADPYYYYMFPFKKKVRGMFDDGLAKIDAGKHPFEDKKLFIIIDDILS
jgi:hypothetical protein